MIQVAIVGGGKGGTALLNVLHGNPHVTITGVADQNRKAPGIQIAKEFGIYTTTRFEQLFNHQKPHLVIDVTGDNSMRLALKRYANSGVEVIGGLSAQLMWKIIDDRIREKEEAERLLAEYQSLYSLGVKLTASENIGKLYTTIVDYALRLIGCPAGNLALFDEKSGEMYFAAARGFSKAFSRKQKWEVRKGGLTSTILNQKTPLAISDIQKFPNFDNPMMVNEKIRSLIAVTLAAEGKIIGILYVNDFKVRDFSTREVFLLGLLSTIAAMTIEKTRNLENARHLAITDELTELYNHRHFLQQLHLEINRAKRYNRKLTLLMIDIDHFKTYNDHFGHLKGNEVLKKVGSFLRMISREVDIPARYGGEEFAIIMPETQKLKARFLAERLRRTMENHVFEGEKILPGGQLTISLGLATFPSNADNPTDLIEKADRALYLSKERGRNRVSVSRDRVATA
ncbi:MAG TPA: diguanylate cyclase [Nitrospiria bacterium]